MRALADRALPALEGLLEAFRAADAAEGGALLGEALRRDEDLVYRGLVATLLRLVFLLHAEGRGLSPGGPGCASVAGLHEELCAPAGRSLAAMEQSFGAWETLLSIFRAAFARGATRVGGLFDPGAYPFLEGRPGSPPKVSDAAVYRVLEPLLAAGGERLSYDTLDIEEMGSVYEAVMGFSLKASAGSLSLQPTGERRRSGSHYTPRALVEPIVATTLGPVLEGLKSAGEPPRPEQILALRVCDPAMGSGAFLMAACDALASELVLSFRRHGEPLLADGDDPLSHARRLVAQRCLRGVDKDRVAVELARLSLWLFTRAEAEPLSFLDQSLRQGDSMVGLPFARPPARAGKTASLPGGLSPFHWPLAFPEVFSGENPGFDAIIGNPPFLGGKRISTNHGDAYAAFLVALHPGSSRNADLAAHFFRRAFDLLRPGGAFGLIATNTIAQGDTRAAGLRWICEHGGSIYDATTRCRWPGAASVIVSVVHVAKGPAPRPPRLDGKRASRISAFLLDMPADGDPVALEANRGKSFIGCFLRGMGFTFDDASPEATPLSEMSRLVRKNPANAERIFPYLGGEELNASPTHAARRHVIHFGSMTREEACRWPDLMAVVEAKVKPQRDRLGSSAIDRAHKQAYWRFANDRPELARATRGMQRVLAIARVSQTAAFTFVPTGVVCSEQIVVFALDSYAAFAVLQSRVHEVWARFLASTMGDGMRYTPSDCFESFPFPAGWAGSPALEDAGRALHEARAAEMVRSGQGLTATYNRFHDIDEQAPEIACLRVLHDAVDRAVLGAYGWGDLEPTSEHIVVHGEDEGGSPGRKRGRRRFPDELRDEVLTRLLSLNLQRAAEERGSRSQGQGSPDGQITLPGLGN